MTTNLETIERRVSVDGEFSSTAKVRQSGVGVNRHAVQRYTDSDERVLMETRAIMSVEEYVFVCSQRSKSTWLTASSGSGSSTTRNGAHCATRHRLLAARSSTSYERRIRRSRSRSPICCRRFPDDRDRRDLFFLLRARRSLRLLDVTASLETIERRVAVDGEFYADDATLERRELIAGTSI